MQEPSSESPSAARTKSIGSKVTEEEYASLERLAQDRKMTLSEWCRQVMLAQLNPEPSRVLNEAPAVRSSGRQDHTAQCRLCPLEWRPPWGRGDEGTYSAG